MIVLAIDPGPKDSAFVEYDSTAQRILNHDYLLNEALMEELHIIRRSSTDTERARTVVIEWIEGYGLTVGRETFDTCRWVGKFECAAGYAHLLGRKAIKSHLCSTTTAKDRDIRAALIDRFGEPGTKKHPGPTFGFAGDQWAALACAVTWADTHKE